MEKIFMDKWNIYKINHHIDYDIYFFRSNFHGFIDETKNKIVANITNDETENDLTKLKFLMRYVHIFRSQIITFMYQLKEFTKEYIDIIYNESSYLNVSHFLFIIESKTSHENFIYLLRKILIFKYDIVKDEFYFNTYEHIKTMFYKNLYNFDDFITDNNPNIMLSFILNFINNKYLRQDGYLNKNVISVCKKFIKDYTNNQKLTPEETKILNSILSQ